MHKYCGSFDLVNLGITTCVGYWSVYLILSHTACHVGVCHSPETDIQFPTVNILNMYLYQVHIYTLPRYLYPYYWTTGTYWFIASGCWINVWVNWFTSVIFINHSAFLQSLPRNKMFKNKIFQMVIFIYKSISFTNILKCMFRLSSKVDARWTFMWGT